MPIIAVVNRKGGSGKSTIATHLAAHLTRGDKPALLGDVDRQQSTQGWLKRRAARKRPRVVGWSIDPKTMVRPPAGSGPVVLDTPGGLRGFDLARVVMYADAILMPVCASAFDRESAAECFAELQALPRVASGRCKLAAVGMRIDGRTRGAQTLAAWATSIGVPFVGVLRESQTYVRCVEEGLTVFDLPPSDVKTDLAQWAPVLRWVEESLAGDAASADGPATVPASLIAGTSAPAPRSLPPASMSATREAAPSTVMPAPEPAAPPMVAAVTASAIDAPRPAPVVARRAPRTPAPVLPTRAQAPRQVVARPALSQGLGLGRLLGSLAIPKFLLRDRSA
jgi:cellulose biosynthesis protein BcsQ